MGWQSVSKKRMQLWSLQGQVTVLAGSYKSNFIFLPPLCTWQIHQEVVTPTIGWKSFLVPYKSPSCHSTALSPCHLTLEGLLHPNAPFVKLLSLGSRSNLAITKAIKASTAATGSSISFHRGKAVGLHLRPPYNLSTEKREQEGDRRKIER
jgi:hypothetical protein